MSSSRCSSSEVRSRKKLKRSNSHVSPGPSSITSSSGNTVKLATPRKEQCRGHQCNSAPTISGNTDCTVSDASSVVDRVGTSEPLEKEVVYTSTNQSVASDIPWPMWPVSHMMTFSSLEKVASHYRALKLADHLNDKDLRSFLDEQLSKEKAGLSEITISMRLRSRVMRKVGENPETCSICMMEFKDEDTVASLYYCSHEYHANCIKEWLQKCNLCPLCRALAIIPENYPSWDADVKLHQVFFPAGNLVIEGFSISNTSLRSVCTLRCCKDAYNKLTYQISSNTASYKDDQNRGKTKDFKSENKVDGGQTSKTIIFFFKKSKTI